MALRSKASKFRPDEEQADEEQQVVAVDQSEIEKDWSQDTSSGVFQEEKQDEDAHANSIHRYPGAYREGGNGGNDDLTLLDDSVVTSGASIVQPQAADATPILVASLVPEQAEHDNENTDTHHHKQTTRPLLIILIVVVLVGIIVAVVVAVVMTRDKKTSPSPNVGAPAPSPTEDTPLDGEWVQLGQDLDGEAAQDNAGFAVAISGDASVVAVGAWRNDGVNGVDSGHVRLYRYNGDGWTKLGQQDIDGAAAEDRSGRSVALSEDGRTVAIGARFHGVNAGHVRVFSYNDESDIWQQIGKDILGDRSFDMSGHSISLSSDGKTVAIGSIWNDDFAEDAGQVRVFVLESNEWVQRGQALLGDKIRGEFGRSVSLSSDGLKVAAGATFPFEDDIEDPPGRVRVFSWNGQEWNRVGQLLKGETNGDGFGNAVHLSSNGRVLAVGAPLPTGTGTVRVYAHDGKMWAPMGNAINGEDPKDQFGRSLALSANGLTLVGGAYRNSNNGRKLDGSARVFSYDGNTWVQVGSDINGEGDDDRTGWSVSIDNSGQTIAIGGRLNDGEASPNSGHVRIFELVP